MAWIFLDSSKQKEIRVGWRLACENVWKVRRTKGRSERILFCLSGIYSRLPEKLEGILVVRGPGSFSSVRIGVMLAMLLSRLWDIPCLDISAEETEELASLSHLDRKKSLRSCFITPLYDAEPNITMPSKKGF